MSLESTSSSESKPDSDSGFAGLGGLAIVAAVLWFLNPGPAKHGKALGMEGFTGFAVGALALVAGADIKYNNYLLFSTVSVTDNSGKSKTVSFGALGLVKALD